MHISPSGVTRRHNVRAHPTGLVPPSWTYSAVDPGHLARLFTAETTLNCGFFLALPSHAVSRTSPCPVL